MPIPSLTTSGFTAKEDSKYFSADPIDQAITFETEGGVFLSRPRNTRDPGFVFTTAFSDITQSDMDLLNAFYASVRGGSSSFQYTHPVTNVTYVVRFVGAYRTKYVGAGSRKRYDVTDIKLRVL